MCYFFNLYIQPQRGDAGPQSVLKELAKNHGLRLRGEAPIVQITDGHCSCNLVAKEGRGIRVAAFLEDLVRAEEIKYVKVGWTWASGQIVRMPQETVEQRLSLSDFLTNNKDSALSPDIWYRLYDEDRYRWEA